MSATLPANSRTSRVPATALVLAASLALSIVIALSLPLLDPDEGRNAEVAREMAVNGDLVIPHLAGMPYLDKPPGFFWAAALAIRALGHTPLAARLPSMLASLALLALFARSARRAGGTRFATIAAALLASAPLYAALSAYVIFDMMLALCVTVVWLGVAAEVEAADAVAGSASAPALGATARRLAMFAAIAAGILIKGPVMLAWAVGGSAGAALVLRSRAPLRWLAWWPGWIVALGIPGAWFAAASARFPEYPHYAFVEESFQRVATGAFHRQQPWWFVPAVLAGGTLPWSLLTPWRAALGRHLDPRVNRGGLVAIGWVAFAAIFFTLSRSKLVTYLLPALPPLAWLAAAAWCEVAKGAWGPRLRLAVSLGISALLIGTALVVAMRDPSLPGGAPLAAAVTTSGGGPVRYQGCYSPGTDFLLGRSSELVSALGQETTSNYIVRYRESLVARGLWKAVAADRAGFSGILVRPTRDSTAVLDGGTFLFELSGEYHHRFVAYRFGAPAETTAVKRR